MNHAFERQRQVVLTAEHSQAWLSNGRCACVYIRPVVPSCLWSHSVPLSVLPVGKVRGKAEPGRQRENDTCPLTILIVATHHWPACWHDVGVHQIQTPHHIYSFKGCIAIVQLHAVSNCGC